MAKLNKIDIKRNWGKKDSRVLGMIWDSEVKDGEPYDLVQFSIDEIPNYYWATSIGVKCGTTENEIKQAVGQIATKITDQQIAEYADFLNAGEKYGWD